MIRKVRFPLEIYYQELEQFTGTRKSVKSVKDGHNLSTHTNTHICDYNKEYKDVK